MLTVLINLVIVLMILGLLYWIAKQIPLPAPVAGFVDIVFAVIGVIVLIYFLLGMVGGVSSVRLR